jgi:hypothetical protein
MREHLGRADGDDGDLVDPQEAVRTMIRAAAELDDWHAGGRQGPRPAGRLRSHPRRTGPAWLRRAIGPVYDLVYDPDGRPWRMRLRRRF